MVDGLRSGSQNVFRMLQDLGVSTPGLQQELGKIKDGLQSLDSFLQRHGGGGHEAMHAMAGSHMMGALRQLAQLLSGDDDDRSPQQSQGGQQASRSNYDPNQGGFEATDDGDEDAPGGEAKVKGLKKAMKAISKLGGGSPMMGMMALGAMMAGGGLKGLLSGGGDGGGGQMSAMNAGSGGGGNVQGSSNGGGGGQSFNPLSSNSSDVGGASPKYGKKKLPPELEALMSGGGMCFEDLVAKFMFDTVKQMQQEAKDKMNEIKSSIQKKESGGGGGGAGGAEGGGGAGGAGGAEGGGGAGDDSRNLMFEELKNIMQKLSQVQQALSSVINTMHENAMSAIRHIKV